MDEELLNLSIAQLMLNLSYLLSPDGHKELEDVVRASGKQHEGLCGVLESLRRSRDDLRLMVHYLYFDSEASRREAGIVRLMLDHSKDIIAEKDATILELRERLRRFERDGN